MLPCLHPATLTPGLDISTLAKTAGGAGFQTFETSANALRYAANEGDVNLRWLFQETATTPVYCGWSANLRSSREDFDLAMARTEQEMAFVGPYGVRGGGTVLPFRREPGVPDPDDGDILDRIQQLAERSQAHNLFLALEFVGLHIADAPANAVNNLPRTLELIGKVKRQNVGVLLDSYHWYLSAGTAADIAAIPPGMPLHVHINDAPSGDPARLDDSMRVLPGEGVIDLDQYLGAVAARGYDGPVSVELFSERLRAMEPMEAARLAFAATANALSRVVPPAGG